MCAVPWGVSSTVGRYHEYRGGILSTVGDIMINVGDILSTVGGYHDKCGGYLEYRGDIMMHVGDTIL